jgi:hypothetical protein
LGESTSSIGEERVAPGVGDFLSKLSSYNLFNNLVPGVLFVWIAGGIVGRDLVPHDLVVSLFAYYFLGMVVSRFGSLVMEPLLRRTGFLRYGDYRDFVRASKIDPKIETLLEVSNMYRSITAMLVLLHLVRPLWWLAAKVTFARVHWVELFCAVLLLIFALSFRKQNDYINRRVVANVERPPEVPNIEE